MKKQKPPVLEKGQRFVECDKRFIRVVEVVKVGREKAQIKTVLNKTKDDKFFLKEGRVTEARKDRFYRYSNGYRRLYGFCHDCQVKRGGVVPAHGHRGITIALDICSQCLKNEGCVPTCDYDWPKEGRKAIWD